MKDDELERALARAAKRDPEGDRAARWERLASGKSDDAERADLARLAAEDGDESAMEALAPFDEAFLRGLEDRIEARAAPPRAKRGRVIALFASLAVAAAVALVAGRALRTGPALPEYALELTGAEKSTRGSDTPTPSDARAVTFEPEGELRIVLRPARATSAPVAAVAALVHDGRARAWSPPMRVSSGGVVEIAGPAAATLGDGPGDYEVVIAVGPSDALPRAPEAIVAAASSAELRVFRRRLRVR